MAIQSNSELTGVEVTIEELVILKRESSSINLKSRKKALASMVGGHRSTFRGRGIDFDEARIYQPGDDVRNIDWRVTARTGEPHTKIFKEERERPVYLVVDQGSSMFFGSKVCFKSVAAARAAAILAWSARENGDRIGGLIFSEWDDRELRPKDGKRGIQALFHALVDFNQAIRPSIKKRKTKNSRPFTNAIASLNRVVRPGSMVILISDFSQFDDFTWQNLSVLSRHNDIISVLVFDEMELELPPPGHFSFSDGDRKLMIDTGAKGLRQQYTKRFSQHHKRVRNKLMELGIPLIDLATHNPIGDTLSVSLGQRAKLRGNN